MAHSRVVTPRLGAALLATLIKGMGAGNIIWGYRRYMDWLAARRRMASDHWEQLMGR